jgi:Transcriptional regulator, AbiEi antitoxin
MDQRFAKLAAAAADNHGVFTTTTARAFGVSDRLRHEWVERGWIERLGTRTFRFVGTPHTWQMNLAVSLGDLGKEAAIAGRSAATLNRLDGFTPGQVEVWVPRSSRSRGRIELMRTSSLPLLSGDLMTIDGLRCVTAERLILDSTLFRFTAEETHNAIDSALRMRLVSERRLRNRIVRDLAPNARNRSTLIDALVDTGGESALERRFLAIVRKGGLPRPQLRRVYRSGSRTLARVDAEFVGGLIVEVAGHATHATRVQRQRDEQRRTELTLRGKRFITFTYDDVYGRPNWVLGILREAGVGAAA